MSLREPIPYVCKQKNVKGGHVNFVLTKNFFIGGSKGGRTRARSPKGFSSFVLTYKIFET